MGGEYERYQGVEKHSSGFKLLAAMGWKEGQGLVSLWVVCSCCSLTLRLLSSDLRHIAAVDHCREERVKAVKSTSRSEGGRIVQELGWWVHSVLFLRLISSPPLRGIPCIIYMDC